MSGLLPLPASVVAKILCKYAIDCHFKLVDLPQHNFACTGRYIKKYIITEYPPPSQKVFYL